MSDEKEDRGAIRAQGVVVEYTKSEDENFEGAFIKDISRTGIAMMIYGGAIDKESELTLKIYLSTNQFPLFVKGKVVWCRPSEYLKGSSRMPHDVGVEFVDIEAKNQEMIDAYLELSRQILEAEDS